MHTLHDMTSLHDMTCMLSVGLCSVWVSVVVPGLGQGSLWCSACLSSRHISHRDGGKLANKRRRGRKGRKGGREGWMEGREQSVM